MAHVKIVGYIVLVVGQYRPRAIGPYATFSEAFDMATSIKGGDRCFVVPLEKPEDYLMNPEDFKSVKNEGE